MFDIMLIGVAITIIKVGLFFYPIISLYYFFELRGGKLGGIGSILILAFSTSHHFFIFSTEFYRTLPGCIFLIFASIGYMAQAKSMFMTFETPSLEPIPMVRKPTRVRMPIISPSETI